MDARTRDPAEVKLSCRNLWKVYREDAAPYFGKEVSTGDAGRLAPRMRADGAIPAVRRRELRRPRRRDLRHHGAVRLREVHRGAVPVRLVEPNRGEVWLDREDLLRKSARELIDIRRHKMGMVFQSFGCSPI